MAADWNKFGMGNMFAGGSPGFNEGGNNIGLPGMGPPLGGAGGNMAPGHGMPGPPPPLGGSGGNMAPSPYGPGGVPQGWELDPGRTAGVRRWDPQGSGFDPTRGGQFYRPTNWQDYRPGGSMGGGPQIANPTPQPGGAFVGGRPMPLPSPIGGGGMQPRFPTPNAPSASPWGSGGPMSAGGAGGNMAQPDMNGTLGSLLSRGNRRGFQF